MEERIIRGLGIESGWLDRYPGELSGGELQAVLHRQGIGQEHGFCWRTRSPLCWT